MPMFKPEYIPRILLSLILFCLGSSLLIFANTGCPCPVELAGQPHPPPTYPIWEIVIVALLIGAGVLVLLIPSDKPLRRTGDASTADSSSDSKP